MRGVSSAAWTIGQNLPELVLAPFVAHKALSSEECDELVDFVSRRSLMRARLSGGVDRETIRSASHCWIDEVEFPWLWKRFIGIASDACRENFPFSLPGFDEGFQLLKYDARGPGKMGDFYDWHIDIGLSRGTRSRKLSLVTQLSDPEDYEGGELEISFDGNTRQMGVGKGTVIAFPSFVMHRVCPMKAGTRYSLAAWLHGPSFR